MKNRIAAPPNGGAIHSAALRIASCQKSVDELRAHLLRCIESPDKALAVRIALCLRGVAPRWHIDPDHPLPPSEFTRYLSAFSETWLLIDAHWLTLNHHGSGLGLIGVEVLGPDFFPWVARRLNGETAYRSYRRHIRICDHVTAGLSGLGNEAKEYVQKAERRALRFQEKQRSYAMKYPQYDENSQRLDRAILRAHQIAGVRKGTSGEIAFLVKAQLGGPLLDRRRISERKARIVKMLGTR